ncbi:hypothetical protein [Leucobacter celer]|uniref:hypothetical protein n=1 Tax=Leucobacter celer TaxID=668625 RepID=UPI0012F8F601|nr:hypothetical protein [Leucobacter celer]
MTTSDTRIDPDRILATDADLQDQLGLMLERATHRQLWLLLIDQEHRLAEPLMPMDDHPLSPHELCETSDLGVVPFARVLVHRARIVCELVGAREFVFVWERCGTDRFTVEDREWARSIAGESGGTGSSGAAFGGEAVVPLRAQFVLHDTGIRPLTPDDYA